MVNHKCFSLVELLHHLDCLISAKKHRWIFVPIDYNHSLLMATIRIFSIVAYRYAVQELKNTSKLLNISARFPLRKALRISN